MITAQKTIFQPLDLYPELHTVTDHFEEIKAEARSLRTRMVPICDDRVDLNVWNIFPLLPEEEDRVVVPDTVWQENQKQAPKTTQILSGLGSLKAFIFSSLEPQGHIRLHKHDNPYVTAILCLQDGGNSYIVVNGEKKQFKTGEILIFDYTQRHEVFNKGTEDRVVLLMLLENRLLTE